MNWLAIHLSVGFTPLPIFEAILQGKAETLDSFFNFSFSSAYWLIQFFFPLSIPWPACPFTSLSIPSPSVIVSYSKEVLDHLSFLSLGK